MAYLQNYDFTDWLYNRYVEAIRNNDTSKAVVYTEVLNQFIRWTFNHPRYSQQKRHARLLIKEIYRAIKNGTSHKLVVTGEEGKQEFQQKMAEYEQELRDAGFPEDSIIELVVEKRLNYGN